MPGLACARAHMVFLRRILRRCHKKEWKNGTDGKQQKCKDKERHEEAAETAHATAMLAETDMRFTPVRLDVFFVFCFWCIAGRGDPHNQIRLKRIVLDTPVFVNPLSSSSCVHVRMSVSMQVCS